MLARDEVDAVLWYSYGEGYSGLRGNVAYVGGKPVIGGRVSLWGEGTSGDMIGVDALPAGRSLCRSSFWTSQFECSMGRLLQRLFARYDGTLRWGDGQTAAFLGGAARRGDSTKFKPFGKADEDESLLHTPAWDHRLSRGQPRLLGSASFVADAVTTPKAAKVLRDQLGGGGTTNYELKFPAACWDLESLPAGAQAGIGLTINDGDTEAGQGGQKGWSGWGPYSAVYGKNAEECGLVTLA